MSLKWNPGDFTPGNGGHNTGDILEDGILTLSGTILDSSSTTSGTIAGVGDTLSGAISYNTDILSGTIEAAGTAGGILPIRSFGRVKVANPGIVFDSKQDYSEEPFFFLSHSVNVDSYVTHVRARAASEISSGTGSAGVALRQSRRYFNYEPGRGQLIYQSFNLSGAVENVDKCVGYYDDFNGVFLKLSGSGMPYFVLRKSGAVDEEVPRSEWNSDRFDGLGASGVTVDFTKTQLSFLEFEWLGVGSVYCGFRFGDVDCVGHLFDQNANLKDQVYMQTPNLPVRWEMKNTGVPAEVPTMDAICCSVISEGGNSHAGYNLAASSHAGGRTLQGAAGSIEPILSIRLKQSSRRATIFPASISVLAASKGNFRWLLSINPVVGAGTAPDWHEHGLGTHVQIDVEQSGLILSGANEGIVLATGYTSEKIGVAGADATGFLTIASDYEGVSDILTLSVQKLAAQSETFYGAIEWTEIP